MVKRRLYRLMRSLFTTNWAKFLSPIVKGLNHTRNSALGNLRPSDLQSPVDDPKLDAVVGVPEDVPFQKQIQNQKRYENDKTNLKIGDHVYMDWPPSGLEKSFDTPVRTINICLTFVAKSVGRGKGPYVA